MLFLFCGEVVCVGDGVGIGFVEVLIECFGDFFWCVLVDDLVSIFFSGCVCGMGCIIDGSGDDDGDCVEYFYGDCFGYIF